MQQAIHTLVIDLNADLGEGYPHDEALLQLVSSCSIACGGHAGDAQSMRAALRAAKKAGVSAGAHPSYPDREGFGRRAMVMPIEDLRQNLYGQIASLKEIASEEGLPIAHVKPHGALYHAVAADPDLAETLISIVVDLGIATVVGPPKGAFAKTAKQAGLNYVAEGFADRAYTLKGELVPRGEMGAMIKSDAARAAQALSLAKYGFARTATGERVSLPVQTICIHGDTDGAFETATSIRRALVAEGITVQAPHA